MPPAKQRVKELTATEKRNRRELEAAALAALLLLGSRSKLTLAGLAARLGRAIQGTHASATDLAETHAEAPSEPRSASERQAHRLGVEAASGALAVALVRSVQSRTVGDDALTYEAAAEQAAKENAHRIKLTADTEFYREYNDRYISAVANRNPDAVLVWDAVLDKLTCGKCDELDGTEVKASEGFSSPPPLHPRCRCHVYEK